MVAVTPVGRKTQEDLRAHYANKRLLVESSRSEKAQKFFRSPGVAGVYFRSTIFVDEKLPLLALVTTLFHEMVHATDYLSADSARLTGPIELAQDYLLQLNEKAAAGERVSEEERSALAQLKAAALPLVADGERRAYSRQNRFLEQLIETQRLEEIVEKLVTDQFILAYPMRQKDFRRWLTQPQGMHADAYWVDAYLETKPFREE